MNYGRIGRLGGCAAVAIVLSSLIACGGAQSRMAAHMQRGKTYLEEGNFKKGGVEFRNALQIDPKNLEARILIGRVAEQSGDFREAVASYRGAIELDENSAPARAALGRIMVFAGEPAQALELVAPALVKFPDDADLLTVRAAARMVQKDVAGAQTDAEQALKTAPYNENTVALLASIYRASKDLPRAEKLVREAVEHNPAAVDLREVLASLYADLGEEAKVEAELRKVVELRPLELSRRTRLALYLARNKRADDAQNVLQEAVKAMPDDDQAKLQLVDFISSQRSREQGEKSLRAFIAADPKNDDLRLGLGALLQRAGANADALTVYREIVTRDENSPKSLVARNRIATMQIAAGEMADAQKTIDEVLKKNPRDLDSLTLRGNLALERQDAPAAIADLRAVLREQPEATMVRRALARAHLVNREPALAEDTLREALRTNPNDSSIRIDLAQLLSQTNRVEQAVALMEETVRRAPADAAARETLVRAYISNKDLPSARTAAEDLKTLRPESAAGPYLAGLIAQGENRLDDSQKELERAIELQPGAVDALASLSRLEIARGRSARVLALVRERVERDPKNPVVRNLLGEILFLTKDFPGATEQFNRTIGLSPKWWQPYHTLALTRIAAADVPGGLAVLEKGVQATSYDQNLVVELASFYERQRQFEKTIDLYDKLQQRNPKNQAIANNLAMLLVTHRTDKQSLDRAGKLTEGFLSSDTPTLLDTHGWVQLKRGEFQAALPALERATQRAPDSRVIRYHLAMAQLKAGQRDAARGNLETVLADTETFEGIDEARTALADLKRAS